ncbi:MAG: helix-turn-helix domain-containing protein [Verrucomicrobiae bacterium]|nr:helix-turn-helix domain-containing protein [Verrucomicrobiae bacterium]
MSASIPSVTILPAPVVTELISFHCTTFPKARQSFPTHHHHFFQLDVLLRGRLTARIEGERPVQIGAGEGWLIPPLVGHGFEQTTGFRQASFKFRLAPACWPSAGRQWRRTRFSRPLQALLAAAEDGPVAGARGIALATLCVLEALETERRRALSMPTLDRFLQVLWPLLERIETEPKADWTVAALAAASHVSVDHFSREFRRLLGQTPRRYLLEARLRAAAAALLGEPARPIKEIAETSGYATVHAFSAAFKNALGRSPAAYRRARPAL